MTTNRAAFTKRRAVLSVGLALSLALSSCGSGDADDSTTAAEADQSTESTAESTAESTTESDSGESDDSEDVSEAEGSAGGGTGTLTTSDGTVYALEFSSCDTSNNNPSALPLDNGYDLSGATDDGFQLVLIRAGLSDDASVFSGALEGNFDENGKNSTMVYVVQNDSVAVTVDGSSVSGTMSMRAIAPDRPHGDEIDATLDVSC